MVFLQEPKRIAQTTGVTWQTVQEDVLFCLQRSQTISAITSIFGTKNAVAPFRIVTAPAPRTEIATASTEEEIFNDADVLRLFVAGVVPEDPSLIPEKVQGVLQEVCKAASSSDPEGASGDARANAVAEVKKEWKSAEVLKQLEPWALKLMENSDKLRYICYALKVATSAGADLSTAGMGGEELVQCCFLSVDAALVSSWLTWFGSSLLDSSEASNVVRKTLTLDFGGGPRSIAGQADAICASIRPEDIEPVTQLALSLKRRIAILVGDLCSLFIKNDMAIGGCVISEMLIRMVPAEASEGLRKLVSWYEVIPGDKRALLEDCHRLSETLNLANNKVKGFVMSQYEKPLHRKALDAGVRQLVLLPVPFSAYPNLALTAALGTNVGKQSCDATFATVEDKMPEIAAAMRKALSIAFGTLILLAHCADKADSPQGQNKQEKLGWTAVGALEGVLPAIMAAQSRTGSTGRGSASSGLVGAISGALQALPGGSKKK